MARQPRIEVKGFPQHLIQRGNNRHPCFFTDSDRRHYLRWLKQAATKYGAEIHTYVLMSNHVHLLVTGKEEGALGHVMQSLGRRYVRYINETHGRSGTLWEGRFRSNIVEGDRYLLACYRYIELNPVRAGIVDKPHQYPWSSFHYNALGIENDVVTPHATYTSLGSNKRLRLMAYEQLFRGTLQADEITAIRNHVNQGKVLGSESFVQKIEESLNRRVRLARPGRPPGNVL